ncbi:MAG: hypothetical protein ACLT1J_14025 [Mediterraneibacter gnavus]
MGDRHKSSFSAVGTPLCVAQPDQNSVAERIQTAIAAVKKPEKHFRIQEIALSGRIVRKDSGGANDEQQDKCTVLAAGH